ncbi:MULTISPECIES: hypothetical protein [unclassified Paenibacillus]|uniref:hypothetical protein n=1 Tax=unclassified Paenibacillus TaxID=185978 RepID=UPI001AE47EED|nr:MULTISPECIES: hypothetical protein [unclassified Paenibacillus]MBP1153523.1 hypothetical protein [Paenibacillus sp. PvP091]MBP1171094.1 hypothetical protein [Paenibacillus sp. PvR098]MBP2442122.1 hypothetical protein [Paenibacillus sp. PvP052]
MAKKGQIFQTYTEEFKLAAVTYMEGSSSYKAVADLMKIRKLFTVKGVGKEVEKRRQL